jgi:CheY-like chemotaxis protein
MSPYNMNIHTCLSGSEAVELVKQNRYDIVFMDHMMPGMDGLEATDCIRGLGSGGEYYRKLPIVALTANAVSGQREMFLEKGINDFLAKPIDIQKLDEILGKWLPKEKQIKTLKPQEDTKNGKTVSLNIPGVDTEKGLSNMGGSETAYHDILLDFCRDVESRSAKIYEALGSGDLKLYTILVHGLKGAARSIGAMEIAKEAAWLEVEAEKEDISIVKSKNTKLLENLGLLVDEIKKRLEQQAPEGNEQSDISGLNLENLKTALSAMNIEEVNKILLTYSGLSLDTKTRDIISDLEQSILMFEYDQAIIKIDDLLKSSGKD